MSENLHFPVRSHQGVEHEKWKAMVDSVIEFITASRAMLHLLSDKITDSEKWSEDHRKKIEEEKTMAAFYKDYLSLEIVPKLDRVSATTGPSVDIETDVDKLKRDIELKAAMEAMQRKQDNSCMVCKEKRKKLKELAGNYSPIMTSFQNKLYASQEIQSSVDYKTEESQYVADNKSINVQTCSREKCKKCSKHAMSSQQSANTLPKNPAKASRIPKTQSFNDNKTNKSATVERAPNEGFKVGKPLCKKILHKETTYQDLHQKCKSKTPRGGSALQI